MNQSTRFAPTGDKTDRSADLRKALASGQALTIEPGVYVIDSPVEVRPLRPSHTMMRNNSISGGSAAIKISGTDDSEAFTDALHSLPAD